MAAIGKQYAVSNAAATKIAAGRKATATNRDAANSVFLGSETVDATGYELKAGETVELDARTDDVYAIASVAGPVRVDVIALRAAN